jgi:hypothetical protein
MSQNRIKYPSSSYNFDQYQTLGGVKDPIVPLSPEFKATFSALRSTVGVPAGSINLANEINPATAP